MMVRVAAIACALLLGVSQQQDRPTGTQIRYVANSGMLVAVSGRRFLIDAPIRSGIPPYATSSAAERALLEGARGPYESVDAILITHWHEDHFSPEAVAAHLSSNPRSMVVSSPEVVQRVRALAPQLPDAQLRAVLPALATAEPLDVGGVPIRVLRIRHNPARRLPEQHVGFLIGSTATVLHVGDADPAADNFAVLKSLPPVDIALLPFWYLSDADNLRLVRDSIRPRHVVAMHIPPTEVERVSAAVKAAGANAAIAAVPGSDVRVP